MPEGRNPSGLPRGRILGPIYGPAERDMDTHVHNQHGGARRVRRTFLVIVVLIGLLTAAVAIFGSTASATGMVTLFLAPLVIILGIAHLAVMFTGPDEPGGDLSGRSRR